MTITKKNYWKPTTPEQIANFKERRKIINKASKERIKLRQKGLLEPAKMGRGDALTPEQRDCRNELQRIRNEKSVKLDSPKPSQPRKARKLPIGRKEKPATLETRVVNLSELVAVYIPERKMTVYVKPGKDIEQVKNKYKIVNNLKM